MTKDEKIRALKAWLIVGGIFLLTIGVFAVVYNAQNSTKTYDPEKGADAKQFYLENANEKIIQKPREESGNIGDHVRGKVDSNVVFVEYGDMQCPGCAASYSNVEKLFEKYGDKVAFVFRQFPISSHVNASSAAAAVESAGAQGRYWDMINALYLRREEWISLREGALLDMYQTIFSEIAPEGDTQKFRDGITNSDIKKKVEFDYGYGRNVDKVTATPAFYINGVAIDIAHAQTQAELKTLLELALETAIEENGV